MTTDKEIEQKVTHLVSVQLARPVEGILLESHFRDDLAGDSLDEVELMIQIEEEFEIDIPDDESLEIRTIGEIVAYVKSKIVR
jgi:acyl carrier protein